MTWNLPTDGGDSNTWGSKLLDSLNWLKNAVDGLVTNAFRVTDISANNVPVKSAGGAKAQLPFSYGTVSDSLAVRGTGGTMAVGTATADTHAVTKLTFDGLANDAFKVSGINPGSVPVKNAAGSSSFLSYNGAASNSSIAVRTATGTLRAAAPTDAADLTPKTYVDTAIAGVNKVLVAPAGTLTAPAGTAPGTLVLIPA